jgi:hypothetical protein
MSKWGKRRNDFIAPQAAGEGNDAKETFSRHLQRQFGLPQLQTHFVGMLS